jgi:hypothetical protein
MKCKRELLKMKGNTPTIRPAMSPANFERILISTRTSTVSFSRTSRDFRDLKGHQINRVPEYKYLIGIDIFPIENVRCNVDLNVTGPYGVDYLNRIENDEKKTVDVGIRYEREQWSLWLLAKNIFDEEIEAVYNSNGQLNTTAEDIVLNGLYANDYYPRQGQYFEIGGSIRF